MPSNAWSDLHWRRRTLAIGIVAVFAVDLGALLTPALRGLPCIVVTIVGVLVALRCERFRCPSCGARFGRRGMFHNAFARRCLHCGTEIGAAVPR